MGVHEMRGIRMRESRAAKKGSTGYKKLTSD